MRNDSKSTLWLLKHFCLAEYLASPEGHRILAKSEAHRLLLEEFCAEQKSSGMEFSSMSL